MVNEAVADPHHQEGKARVGGGEVDHDRLLAALRLVDGQQVGAEVGTQPATVPGGLCQYLSYLGPCGEPLQVWTQNSPDIYQVSNKDTEDKVERKNSDDGY